MLDKIKVSYTFSLDHYRALLRGVRQRRRRPLWQWVLFASFFLLMAMLMMVPEDGRLDLSQLSQPEALLPLALAVIGLPLMLVLVRLVFHLVVYPLTFKRSGAAGQLFTYVIDDTGIQWTRPNASGVTQWPAICAVTRLSGDEGIVLWTGQRAGILLPREAFGAQEDIDKVEALAKARMKTRAQPG